MEALGPDGKTDRVFYLRYRTGGRQIEEKAGYSRQGMTAAKANHIRAARINGDQSNKQRRQALEAAKAAEAGRWTFDRLWNEYQATRKIKGIRTDRNRYENHIQPVFGNKTPAEVAPLGVDRLRLKLLKTKSPATVFNVLELVRRLSNFGVKKKLCPGLAFTVEMPTKDNEKTEVLTPGQLNSLWEVFERRATEPAALIMKLALLTGMRRGEILALRWQDVDLTAGFVFLAEPKGGKSVKLPLSPAAVETLTQCPKHETSDLVFPGKRGQKKTCIRRAVNRIKAEAGLPANFRAMHGLRHVFASLLVENGIDLYQVQKLLTHKSAAMTQRYSHLKDQALKDAASTAAAVCSGDLTKIKKTGTDEK